ncbi:MAG: preprotein translocase subunit SecE [Butyrivibrio sp.]|nr:preprotein translocase subunit SecE [Butyrivibrio sp.]
MENTKVAENKKNKVATFFDGVKAEFNKIIWPNKDSIVKQTTAVVIISVISGALIAVLDYAFGAGINFLTTL